MLVIGRSLTLVLAFVLSGCSLAQKFGLPISETEGGCSHDNTLPPLHLDEADRAMLKSRSNPPKTAADYYFLLPASYFSILENGAERRATFIQKNSLTPDYLHAAYWFECDGGGFDVTIRVFHDDRGPLIAISSSTYKNIMLLEEKDAPRGKLSSIVVEKPRFWRYEAGRWISVDDAILPTIEKGFVIDRYLHHYKAHLQYASQLKFIWLKYELPASGNRLPVIGRENFMEPSKTYVWKEYVFDGLRFHDEAEVKKMGAETARQ